MSETASEENETFDRAQTDGTEESDMDLKQADANEATDDERPISDIERRLLPPPDTPDEEKLALFLEDVKASRTESPVNYFLAWPIIQFQVLMKKHSKYVKYIIYIILLVVYFAWLIAGCILEFDRTLELLVITIIALFFVFWELVVIRNWAKLTGPCGPCSNFMQTNFWFALGFGLVFLVLFLAYIIWDAKDDLFKLVPLAGWVIMTYLMVLLSHYPHRIKWRPVFWGYGLGFVFALFVLRTEAGVACVQYLSDQIAVFLSYADEGAEFVFGQYYGEVWAFFVLPVVIYFSAVVSVLFYCGALEYIIKKLCWLMELTMGTSGPESFVAAANIFVGQTESPLLIIPFVNDLTRSELLACIACGFASIAGSVFGAFIAMGIDASQLLTAIVTSAPVALSCAKLIHPEIQTSKTAKDLKAEKTDYVNVIDAFAGGASQAIPLVANIAAMLIAFVSIIAFFDGIFVWLGLMIRIEDPNLTIDLILSYIFYPFAIFCGVELVDCFLAAKYMGIRLFINEFVAFLQLVEDTERRDEDCCAKENSDGTISWLNKRSETICIYALCGFANIGSVGIVVGGFSAIAPGRKADISQLVIGGLIAGNFACLVRGAIAGILYDDEWIDPCSSRSVCA